MNEIMMIIIIIIIIIIISTHIDFKVLTSILTERSYTHITKNNILPEEQRGCIRNSYGCKDQLLINKMIIEYCKKKKKNLSTSWIDYIGKAMIVSLIFGY